MRKVFALLLSVLMVMSLLVVAGAEGTDVTLSIEPRTVAQGATEVLFDIYLDPNGTKEIGAFQFSVSGEGCTITDVTYRNNDLKYSADEGAFAYFGGGFTDNVYTFVAAGTVQKEYTDDQGKTYPAHIWNAAEKTLIVTLKATIDSGASSCQLKVDVDENSDKRFSVGYDDETGKGVQPYYTVAVDSNPANLSGSGALPGDVNGDGVIDAEDLTKLARVVAKIDALDDSLKPVADVTKDGTVDAEDLTMLARYVAKIITSFE